MPDLGRIIYKIKLLDGRVLFTDATPKHLDTATHIQAHSKAGEVEMVEVVSIEKHSGDPKRGRTLSGVKKTKKMAKAKAAAGTRKKATGAKSTTTKTKRTKKKTIAAIGKPEVGSNEWTVAVPGYEQVKVYPKENNETAVRAAVRKHLKVESLPAGSAVVKGCKIRVKRKATPAAKRRMTVLGQYSKMLWEADGQRKPITAYGKEAAKMAKKDGKI